MVELHLCLRPRQRDRALESCRVAVLVRQVKRFAPRRRNQSPERDARRGAWRNPQPAAETEDRIERSASSVGEGPAIDHRDWCPSVARTAKKSCPVGRELQVTHCFAFCPAEMGRPDLNLAGRSQPPGSHQSAGVCNELCFYEQLGEGWMRGVCSRGRQHDLGEGCNFDLAIACAEIRNRYAANLCVSLRRNCDLERGRDRPVLPHYFRSILGKYDLVTIRLDAARLVSRRPCFAAEHVAQKDIGAPGIAGNVLSPTSDREIPPAAITGTGSRDHHCISAVRQ